VQAELERQDVEQEKQMLREGIIKPNELLEEQKEDMD